MENSLKPIGLYKRRAASITGLAREMNQRNGRFPRERGDIEALPGIGQYIANAIELFVQGHAKPLLDVNMARVLERHFGPRKLVDIRHDPYLQDLAARAVQCAAPKEMNWALLDLASTVCKRRNPSCATCPVKRGCRYNSSGEHGKSAI